MCTPTRQRFPTENVHKLVVKAMRVGTHIFESRGRGQNTRCFVHARFQDNFLDSPPSRSARVASAGAPERTCATQRFIKSDCSLPPLAGFRRYVLRVVCGQETPDASTALQPNSTNRSTMVFSTLRPVGARNRSVFCALRRCCAPWASREGENSGAEERRDIFPRGGVGVNM